MRLLYLRFKRSASDWVMKRALKVWMKAHNDITNTQEGVL
jgi:hypothetical protein